MVAGRWKGREGVGEWCGRFCRKIRRWVLDTVCWGRGEGVDVPASKSGGGFWALSAGGGGEGVDVPASKSGGGFWALSIMTVLITLLS